MKIEDEIKSSFKNEKHKAMVNLLYTHYQVVGGMRDYLKNFDITLQQFNILRILRGQYPNPTCIGLIKDRMLDKSSDVSRIVDRLLLKNYIERTECKTDRRQKDVVISTKGLKLLDTIDADDMQQERQLLNLSEDEALQLNVLLDKIRE